MRPETEVLDKRIFALHKDVKGRYAFIRIPKTGTQSMNLCFGKGWEHCSASYYQELVGSESWDKAFTFSIVRNPWARMYSFYKFHRSLSGEEHKLFQKYTHFKEWALDGCPHHYTRPNERFAFPKNVHSQFDWLSKNDELIVDYVARLENIDEDCKFIFNKTGVDPHISFPYHNRYTQENEYQEHYDTEVKDAVAISCGADVEFFGYEFNT